MTLTEAIGIVESVWADPEDPITDAKEKEALRVILQAAKQQVKNVRNLVPPPELVYGGNPKPEINVTKTTNTKKTK